MAEVNDDNLTFGREEIYTDAEEITRDNILDVLDEVLETHDKNRADIQYLFDVYRGKMDILNRIKDVRPEINNKVVVNYPHRIVRFKTGYELGEPIQYVSKSSDPDILVLNDCLNHLGKKTKDISLAEWVYICGVGYRFADYTDKDVPFFIATLDPRFAFVVYDRNVEKHQMMSCYFSENSDGEATYHCYTDTRHFTVFGDEVTVEPYSGVRQPIIEYHFNNARLGAFEPVMSLINAINRVSSDRLDGVDQFVQALMMFKGVNIESQDYAALKEEGAIVVPPDGDIKYLIQEMNQTQNQTLIDALYDEMHEIIGIPKRSSGLGAGDTGISVVYRDGWEEAESYARGDEMMFAESETKFLELICDIMNRQRHTDLLVDDIEIKFTRRNYENLVSKSEVLLSMLSSDWIHPKLAFTYSGMFPDPETAYKMSEEYHRETVENELNELSEDENRRDQPAESV